MVNIWSSGTCCDCGKPKVASGISGSFQCEACFYKLFKRIMANSYDIQSPEKRLEFLNRKAIELKINKSPSKIKDMADKGFDDWQILTNKKIAISRVRGYGLTKFYNS